MAKALAARCGMPAIDLDEVIEKAAGESPGEIIRKRGEIVFRELEYRALCSCPDGVIISGGGGSFISDDFRAYLKTAGIPAVFLDLPWECLLRRAEVQAADRPLWQSEEQARRLFESRIPFYRLADYRLELSGDEAPDQIVDLLLQHLPELQCAT